MQGWPLGQEMSWYDVGAGEGTPHQDWEGKNHCGGVLVQAKGVHWVWWDVGLLWKIAGSVRSTSKLGAGQVVLVT